MFVPEGRSGVYGIYGQGVTVAVRRDSDDRIATLPWALKLLM